jgi:hypothetical protein
MIYVGNVLKFVYDEFRSKQRKNWFKIKILERTRFKFK